ncbi:MAG: class I SAM-dependent methyltransferase [Rhodospirillaceae bacterium]|nr:class I SAM-dependent methyltransferase [Rhodospirillaceae bacterium]
MPSPAPPLSLIAAADTGDYALLDSGAGRKLERFGAITVDRPEPQAMWRPRLDAVTWQGADGAFDAADDDEQGRWRHPGAAPNSWPVGIGGVTVMCRFSAFRHMGLFPEQAPHWAWMADRLKRCPDPRPRVLNLFAYTGAASLIAARAGAEVTHVDASKKSVAWAKDNQAASGLSDAPIRWIVDDARKFAAREVRRGRSYHMLLIDPPKFGRGPEGETWELFDHLPELLANCAKLIDPVFGNVILTAYAIRASAVALGQTLQDALAGRDGRFETGELAIPEAGANPRLLPTSLYVRWQTTT